MKKKGFTLVELLVVIGIIALLISMLLPSLKKARESANSIMCQSNMRQLGMGFFLYGASNGKFYPPATYAVPTTNTNYAGNVQWYGAGSYTVYWFNVLFPGSENGQNVKTFFCPNGTYWVSNEEKVRAQTMNISYGYNHLSFAGANGTWTSTSFYNAPNQHLLKRARINGVKRSQETMLLAENGVNPTRYDWGAFNLTWYHDSVNEINHGYLVARHGRNCNILWADGHVSPLTSVSKTLEPWALTDGLYADTVAGEYPEGDFAWIGPLSKTYPNFWIRAAK